MPRSRKDKHEQDAIQSAHQQAQEQVNASLCPACKAGLLHVEMQAIKVKCPACKYMNYSKNVETIEKD